MTVDQTALGEHLVTLLHSAVQGLVLLPGDECYDAARTVWNAMIDRRPAVIVRAAGVPHVVTAVNFARNNGLLFSVRGGGHNVTGSAVADGGLMLDMSGMKGIWVDPEKQTAQAEPGCLWRELDRETQAFGLAVTGGQASDTGIAGLTLLYPASQAADLLRFYRDWMSDAPDELNVTVALLTAPPEAFVPEGLRLKPAVGVLICYVGDIEAGRRLVAPLTEAFPPAAGRRPRRTDALPYLNGRLLRLVPRSNASTHC
jgi:FAD binding domain